MPSHLQSSTSQNIAFCPRNEVFFTTVSIFQSDCNPFLVILANLTAQTKSCVWLPPHVICLVLSLLTSGPPPTVSGISLLSRSICVSASSPCMHLTMFCLYLGPPGKHYLQVQRIQAQSFPEIGKQSPLEGAGLSPGPGTGTRIELDSARTFELSSSF